MRILFDGYYGVKNSGDDAFVEVVSWGALKKWKIENYRFLGKSENLPHTRVISEGLPFSIPKTSKLQKVGLLLNSDYLISAGGSTFHSIADHSSKFYAKKLKNWKKKLKLGAIGVSLGPFKSTKDEKKVVEYLKNLKFLCLRDTYSYEYAQSLDLPYEPTKAFDLAALLPKVYSSRSKIKSRVQNKPVIGISVCNYESYIQDGDINQEEKRNKYMEDLLRFLENSGDYKFNFFIINDHPKVGDRSLTKRIISNVLPKDYEIIPYSRYTEKTWRKIESCDIMISIRMHGGIFACFSGTPFFMIEYHRKCTDFLNDIGQAEKYRIYDGKKDIGEIGGSILSVLEENNYTPPSNKDKMIDRAMKNFTEVDINGE